MVLEEMSVYLEDALPRTPGNRQVVLDLSSQLVRLVDTQPALGIWLEEWRTRGVDIVWQPVSAKQHSLRIEYSANRSGFWNSFLEALGIREGEVRQPGSPLPTNKKPGGSNHNGRYQLIEEAISGEIENQIKVMQEYAQGHTYLLESVELCSLQPAAELLLLDLLKQPVAIRVGFVQKLLNTYKQHHYAKLSAKNPCTLARLDTNDLPEQELAAAMQRTPSDSPYLVFLRGQYEELPAHSQTNANSLSFEVFDGASGISGQPRKVALSGSEILIGRDGLLRVDGKLASRQHCILRIVEGGATLEDLNSTHGTFLGKQRLIAGQATPVTGELDIRLGTDAADDTAYADYPRIRVTLPSGTVTPVIKKFPTAQVTPILKGGSRPSAEQTRLAELHILDHGGQRVLPVYATPYQIGRSPDCDAVINEANTGVSRIHLSIESFAENGTHAKLTGTHGAALKGQTVNPGQFLWPWDAPLELAINTKGEYPTPVLILKRPA